jgi:hypothetical protein
MIRDEIILLKNIKIILLFLVLACLLVFSGCKKKEADPVFSFPLEKVQSFSVYTYDTAENTTTSNWVYTEKDMKAFLDYLDNLSGTRVNKPDTTAFPSSFYGIELNVDNPYTLLILGDYAINYKGEYFKIDGKKAEEMCQSIVDDTRESEGVSYILNHRYLSLLEGIWDTTYMTESHYTEAPLENATLTMVESSIDTQKERLVLTLENHTGSTLQFGSMYSLEVLVGDLWYYVGDLWYYVGDMINSNINIGWTSILFMLKNDESMGDTYHLQYFQPLPPGTYRLVKAVTTEVGTEGYLSVEFQVE